MEAIDLNAQEVNLDAELASLDTSGQEIFEWTAIEEPCLGEPTCESPPSQDQIAHDHAPTIDQSKRVLEAQRPANLLNITAFPSYSERRSTAAATVEERLLLVKKELEALSELQKDELGYENCMQLEKNKSMFAQVAKTSEDLIKQLHGKLLEHKGDGEELLSVTLPRIKVDAKDMQRLLSLERRIDRLERIIGPSEVSGKSLITKLNVVSADVKLLRDDGAALERFHKRLHEINEEYENSLLGRKSKDSSELKQHVVDEMNSQESMVNDLFKYNDLLQEYGPIFPQLTNRIRQISGISVKFSETFELVRTMDLSIVDLQEHAEKWKHTTQALEDRLSKQEVDLENNIACFNRTIERLEGRLYSRKED